MANNSGSASFVVFEGHTLRKLVVTLKGGVKDHSIVRQSTIPECIEVFISNMMLI